MDKEEIESIDPELIVSDPGDFRSSLEGLSEREVRVLVQDEFNPGAQQGHQTKASSVRTGSGSVNLNGICDHPLNVHDGVVAFVAAGVPIAPTMSLTTAEHLIRGSEVAATNGDLFLTGKLF